MSGEGTEREGEGESQAGSMLPVYRPTRGSKPGNREIMARAKIESRMLNRLSHPGTPNSVNILKTTVLFFLMLIFERNRDRARVREGKRKRETEDPKWTSG